MIWILRSSMFGGDAAGAEHDEFLVNNDKLNEIILNLFYKIED